MSWRRVWKRWWLRARRSAAARGAGVAFVAQAAGALLTLGTHVVLARWGGPTAYGAYSVAVAWATTLAVAVGAGLPEAALRFIPTYEVEGDGPLLRGLVRRGEHLAVLLGLGVAALGTGVVWATSGLGGIQTGSPSGAVLVGLWALPGIALVRFYTEACRAVDRIGAAYLVPRLVRPGLLLAGFVGLGLAPWASLSGVSAVVVFGAAFLPVVVLQRRALRRYLATRTALDGPRREERQRWRQVAGPLLLVTGFVMLLQKADLLLVGWLMDAEAAGLYQAAVTVAAPVSFVLAAVNAVAAPRFARLHAGQDPNRFRAFVRRMAHGLFWPALALSLVLASASTFLLNLLGPDYLPARLPLFLLIASHLVNAGAGSVGYLLNMTGHHGASARVYGGTTVFHLALTAAGIHFFGLTGAAAATALSTLVWNAWLHVLVQKRLGVAPSILASLLGPLRSS